MIIDKYSNNSPLSPENIAEGKSAGSASCCANFNPDFAERRSDREEDQTKR